jgi:CubicO group peptidase (beta-lactamase class C family)
MTAGCQLFRQLGREQTFANDPLRPIGQLPRVPTRRNRAPLGHGGNRVDFVARHDYGKGLVQRMNRLTVLAGVLLASNALAAPEEEALGKAQGYPVCAPSVPVEARCLVGMVSHYDEILQHRKVAAGSRARLLKRAPAEPAIRYAYQSRSNSLDDYLSRNRTTGLLILKGDTILVERYQYDRTPEQRMTSYSMAKTIVALLVGVALSEGAINSLDDRTDKYVGELKDTPYGETPIRHLLTMSSGVRFSETYRGADDFSTLVRLSVLKESDGGPATVMPFRTRERPPGERFHYSSADTQVLGLVLRAATGKPLSEYLSEKIWKPMGAEADASWIIDKGGYETAYTSVNATVPDYARLGMLLANDGALEGGQIVPSGWVRAMTTPSAKQFEPGQIETFSGACCSPYGYGYQTWILPGSERQFMLWGLRMQFIFVEPKSKLVMVHTAAGDMGPIPGELLALWFGVVKDLAE